MQYPLTKVHNDNHAKTLSISGDFWLRKESSVVQKPFQTDEGYGRRGTPIFTGVFGPLARVALYPTDKDGLGTWFAAA